jgi:hypothetical protein
MNTLIAFLLLLPIIAIAFDTSRFVLTGYRSPTRPRCPRYGQLYFRGKCTLIWDGETWATENQIYGD